MTMEDRYYYHLPLLQMGELRPRRRQDIWPKSYSEETVLDPDDLLQKRVHPMTKVKGK